jgi:hypothetical protein
MLKHEKLFDIDPFGAGEMIHEVECEEQAAT